MAEPKRHTAHIHIWCTHIANRDEYDIDRNAYGLGRYTELIAIDNDTGPKENSDLDKSRWIE